MSTHFCLFPWHNVHRKIKKKLLENYSEKKLRMLCSDVYLFEKSQPFLKSDNSF